jgi:hypothetical protein
MRLSTGCIQKAGCSFGLLLLVPGWAQTNTFLLGRLEGKKGEPRGTWETRYFPGQKLQTTSDQLAQYIIYSYLFDV